MTAKALWVLPIGLTLLLVIPAVSQDSANKPADDKDRKDAAAPKRETVAKPLTPKQIKRKEAALKKELETPWKKWLNEDVAYIITDEERKAFKQMNTDEEREQFVEQFWLRRDPTPDTVENEYQGRALPAHRLRQRTLRLGHSRLEDRSRPHLHHLRPAR